MPSAKTALPLVLALGAASLPAAAVNLGFLKQTPVRYMNDTDLALLSSTIDGTLEDGAVGERRDWSSEKTSAGGEVKSLREFEHDGMPCKRLEIKTHARLGTMLNGRSVADFCHMGGAWKVVRMP